MKAQDQLHALFERMASGAVGIGKAIAGIDATEPTLQTMRIAICRSCPDDLYENGICSLSGGGCGCVLAAKTRIASEKCPRGHW